MKVMPVLMLSLALGLVANSASAYPPDYAHALPANAGCHLMTERECNAHLARLSSLPAGSEREAYLAAHEALIQERSALCGGMVRVNASVTRAY